MITSRERHGVMANKLSPTNDPSQPMIYQIRIKGHLGRQWTDWFGGLVISLEDDGDIAEMSLGVGCVFLCALLFRTRLIPRFLSLAGLIGYPILVAGTIAEIFGIHIGLILTIPGMFFELVLPFWLFIKGFQPEDYGQES